jgi:error-prone DNA polymerase
MQYGASSPDALVARAAELGLDALALTDRDGLYGAVKFAAACSSAGIDPLLGVDLAVEPTGLLAGVPGWADPAADAARRLARSTPARGGGVVDPRHPRVTVLAHSTATAAAPADLLARPDLGGPGGAVAPGWSALCRLVSATHLRGSRGAPVTTPALVARHARGEHLLPGALRDGLPGEPSRSLPPLAAPVTAATRRPAARGTTLQTLAVPDLADVLPEPGALTVLLGPTSELGRALLARRTDLARAVLAHWYDLLPLGALAVEVVCHEGPDGTPGSLAHAARMLGFAREAGVPVVLSAAVRYATPDGAATADVLDAARRLVPLGTRHLDRTTAAGYLAGTDEMAAVARRVADAAGLGADGARDLLRGTDRVAERCRLDPAHDLGIGAVHLPEPGLVTRGLARTHTEADGVLGARCEAAIGRRYPGASQRHLATVQERLDAELATIGGLGYPTYFLTVAEVCDLVRDRGVRVAARGSGAGSLVNHLLGISGVDPIAHGLLMERFCTPLRAELPDIDIDVESDRRTEIYEWVLERFGGERVSCVSMMDTYRVRHAVRDAGAALGLPPSEIDAIATAFPHIRAKDARSALRELPELARSGLGHERFDLLFDLVERLDALPRHIALHPCGVLLSNATLLDRTPVEASWQGFPMSQFDKDDVEVLGLLKLDVLGVRMQSAMAHALDEVERVDGPDALAAGRHEADAAYLDPATGRIDLDAVPLDDEATFRLVRSTRTLGCFQIESPGQRELVGKFAPQAFSDLVIDISLFRPGPVKSDMISPFLRARQGWDDVQYLHDSLIPALEETHGVVVFHEQVIRIVHVVAGVPLDEADEVRRRMGTPAGQAEVGPWLRERAAGRGYGPDDVERIWQVLRSFASFGFCKAHAAAFALPTYQTAWLKAHHPAAFLAGVLTHDPGMYPKRLILDDARTLGITVLGLDVNASGATYRVEKVPLPPGTVTGDGDRPNRGTLEPLPGTGLRFDAGVPDARGYGIRLSLTDVKGISAAEVERVVAGQPYRSLADLWHRARPSRPVAERLVLTGALDAVHGLGTSLPVRPRRSLTRRDLLLQVADLDRWSRSLAVGARRAGLRPSRPPARLSGRPTGRDGSHDETVDQALRPDGGRRGSADEAAAGGVPLRALRGGDLDRGGGVREAAARQSQAAAQVTAAADQAVQTTLDLGDAPERAVPSGLPEMTGAEVVRAELEVLGLDATQHVVHHYVPLLRALGATPARDLMGRRSRSEVVVAGVKVATQTPPIRSGRRVVFLTLDDSTGPADATFFEDAQGPYATTVFGSWLLLVRGELRRTGPRGVSLRATGAWDLPTLWDAWADGGLDAVLAVIDATGDAAAVSQPGFVRDDGPARVTGTGRDDGDDRGPADGQGPEADRAAAARHRLAIAARAGDPPPLRPTPNTPAPVPTPVPVASVPVASVPAAAGPVARGPAAAPVLVATPAAVPVLVSTPAAAAEEPPRTRRVLVHVSGFRQSPYADVRPAGDDVRSTRGLAQQSEVDTEERRRRRAAPRRLWHASPGSPGW